MDERTKFHATPIAPMKLGLTDQKGKGTVSSIRGRRPIQTTLPKAQSSRSAIAGLNVRSLASLIDGLVAAVILTPLVFHSRHWWGLDQWVNPTNFQGAEDLYALANRTLYILLFLGWGIAGATITALYPPLSMGYRWLGLNVVDATNGSPPSFTQWALRAVMTVVDAFFLMGMGSLLMLLNVKRQGLRDLVAKTVVVRDPRSAVFP